MNETLTVRLDIDNAQTAASLSAAVTAVPGFTFTSAAASWCDVLFIEVGDDLDAEIMRIEKIRTKGLAGEVYLTSPRRDPEFLLTLLKIGASTFFPQPIDTQEVIAALIKIRKAAKPGASGGMKQNKKMVVTVLGSKGGTGATTAAINLAVAFKDLSGNSSVALLDMNPLLGTVALFLDLDTSFNWASAAVEIERLDATYLLNIVHRHSSGVYVLPAPSEPSQLGSATPETIERLISLMRSAFDIIVIDGTRSFDELSLTVTSLSDTLLVVSELDLPSVVNARKMLEILDGFGISSGKDIKIAINRFEKKSVVSPGEAEKTLGKKIAVMIPNDYETVRSVVNAGKTLSEMNPQGPVNKKFRELANVLLRNKVHEDKKSFFSFDFLGRKRKAEVAY